MRKYLDNNDGVLLKALAPTKFGPEAVNSANHDPESLIRILLNVEQLQPQLSSWLLEKMAILTLEADDTEELFACSQRDKNPKALIPKQILNHLRWLSFVANGEELTDKMIDILDATPDTVQVEIIECLPEIVEDRYHAKVADALEKKLQSDVSRKLTASILDTFTNLTLKKHVLKQLRADLLESNTLGSAGKEELPIIVKFLLSGINPNDAAMEIDSLRENLNLDPDEIAHGQLSQIVSQGIPMTSQAAIRIRNRSGSTLTEKDTDVVVLDIIRVSLVCENKIADAWIRAIDNPAKGMKSLDILVLLVLYSLPNKKKAVESMFQRKIRRGELVEGLLKRSFQNHTTVMRSQFDTMKVIAEVLMRSHERPLNDFGIAMLREAFLNLDRFCQQEVIADLVTKIGNSSLRGCALAALESLARLHPDKLVNYSLFVAGVLDHTATMELSEVRQIMAVMSTLAYHAPNSPNVLRDDLQMVTKKQLQSSGKNLHLKQMGVIGSVAMVRGMAKAIGKEANNSGNITSESSSSSSMDSRPLFQQAVKVLELVKTTTRNMSFVAGLFFDELAGIFCQGNEGDPELDPGLVKWISEQLAEDFESEFISDINEEEAKNGGKLEDTFLPLKLQFGLFDHELENALKENKGDDEEASIALNIGDIVFKSMGLGKGVSSSSRSSTASTRLIPHYRLLSKCVMLKNEGDVGEIDALLGCSIWLPSIDGVYSKFESLSNQEKNAACACLFISINWFRELLNSFAGSHVPEADIGVFKKNVLLRLKHILELQDVLARALMMNVTFTPPTMLHLVDTSSWQPPSMSAGGAFEAGKKGGKGKAGGKLKSKATKRKAGQDVTNVSQASLARIGDTQASNQSNANVSVNEGGDDAEIDPQINWSLYAPFFRELDFDVFNILSYNVVTVGTLPEKSEEKKDPKLRPPELNFLLTDINAKLNHSLLSSKSKKTAFPGKTNKLKDVGFTHLDNSLDVTSLVRKTIGLFDYILASLEEIADYFNRLAELNDGVLDAHGVFNERSAIMISCLDQGFMIFKRILSWKGFYEGGNEALLKKALLKFSERQGQTKSSKWDDILKAASEYFSKFTDNMVNLGCAHSCLEIFDALLQHCPGKDDNEFLPQQICKTAATFLKRDWLTPDKGNKEKGSKFNGHIEAMLTLLLMNAEEPMILIHDYLKDGLSKVATTKGSGDKVIAEEYPNLNKNNLTMHFRVLISAFVSVASKKLNTSKKKDRLDEDQLAKTWTEAFGVLEEFVNVVKAMSKPRNLLAPFLKHSKPFLESFLKHGMPLMDKRYLSIYLTIYESR